MTFVGGQITLRVEANPEKDDKSIGKILVIPPKAIQNGKTCVTITNLPTRMMMGIPSEGMLISAVYEYDGHEGLNLLMLDDVIPAGAKLY